MLNSCLGLSVYVIYLLLEWLENFDRIHAMVKVHFSVRLTGGDKIGSCKSRLSLLS